MLPALSVRHRIRRPRTHETGQNGGRFAFGEIRRLVLAGLTLVLLVGCAQVPSLPTDYSLTQDAKVGLLLASVSYHGGYSGYAMRYRAIGGKRWRELKIGSGTTLLLPGMMDWDIESPGLRGNTFVVELPPGEYELGSWEVSSGPAYIVPTEPFSIRFNIHPGAATYVGNFHFIRESSLGLTVTGVNVQFRDEFIRDLEIIGQKLPNIDASQARNNVGLSEPVEKLGVGNATTINAVIVY